MRTAAETDEFLTPEQRRRELARLLATGLLRLLRDWPASSTPENPSNSERNCLELLGDTVLSVHTG